MDGKKNILITGLPGAGKTTLIKKIAEGLADLAPIGFYTEEIREKGVRSGFALVGLSGKRSLLSHADISSAARVGRYGVDVPGFESFLGKEGLLPADFRGSAVVIIDEVGKMECFSKRFTDLVREALDSKVTLIATVALRGGGLIEEIKKRKDVTLYEVTRSNRDPLAIEIIGLARNSRKGD